MAALASISHRMSGVGLSVGAIVLVAWLWAAATSEHCFAWWQKAFQSPVGMLCLLGWSLAFFYHLCAGVRHLVWDTGVGFEKATYRATNWIVIVVAVALTAITWFAAWPHVGIF
jgi:succinate dehydrogenase / fumarate reductase cytochrome b subunit